LIEARALARDAPRPGLLRVLLEKAPAARTAN